MPVMYLGALTAISWMVSRQRAVTDPGAPVTRFAVVVPAHDEAATIATMLRSMAAVDYPAQLVEVHVVADNCSDDTAAVASTFGVQVHERTDTAAPGKGPALNWLMSDLIAEGAPFDVAVFVDADTTVAPECLRAFDRRFRAGAVAVQGRYGVREAFDSTPAALRWCALACRHHARPLARTAIGGSCGLFGNGMALSRDLVAARRWSDHLVEDMEYQVDLLLDDIRVEYEPDAVVDAEMPHTFDASITQHQRWEQGRIDIARRYVPRLAGRLVRPGRRAGGAPGRVAIADEIADLITPPLSVLAVATATSAAVGLAAAAIVPSRWSRSNALAGCVFVATAAAHVAVGLQLAHAPRDAYRALRHAPRLAVWKVALLARSLGRADSPAWVRTQRNAQPDTGTSS